MRDAILSVLKIEHDKFGKTSIKEAKMKYRQRV